MSDTQSTRRAAALVALMAERHAEPGDYEPDTEEDVRPYLDGRKAAWRFVCVTEHDGKPFYLPCFATAEAAQQRAVHYTRDDIFAETAVVVVDLDTGDRYYPEPWNMPWSMQPRDPEARGAGGTVGEPE